MPWQRHPSLAWGPSAMLVGRHGKGTPTPPLQQLGVGMQTPLPPPGMSTPPAPLRAVLDLQISPQRAQSWSRLPGREGSCHCTSRQQALAVQPQVPPLTASAPGAARVNEQAPALLDSRTGHAKATSRERWVWGGRRGRRRRVPPAALCVGPGEGGWRPEPPSLFPTIQFSPPLVFSIEQHLLCRFMGVAPRTEGPALPRTQWSQQGMQRIWAKPHPPAKSGHTSVCGY